MMKSMFLKHQIVIILFFEWLVLDIHGMDRGVLMRALKLLENKGKLAIFKGASTDDEGVKFSV